MELEEKNVKKGKKDRWAAAAVFSLMIAYINEYNRLAAENKLTSKIKEAANLWEEKCHNFFKENKMISKDAEESKFLEYSIKNFDSVLEYLEPSLQSEYKI